MEYIILVVSIIILILQVRKIYLQNNFNKKLYLKQKQLRVKEVGFIKNKSSFAPNFKLALNVLVVLALVFTISNGVNSQNLYVEADVAYISNSLDNSSEMMPKSFSNDQFKRTDLVVDKNNAYHLSDNVLSVYVISDNQTNLLETIDLVDFAPTSLYQNNGSILVLGEMVESVKDQDVTYNTVVQSFSKNDLSSEKFILNGKLINLSVNGEKLSVSTSVKLGNELVNPFYTIGENTTELNENSVLATKNVNQSSLFNVYEINPELEKVSVNSYALAENTFSVDNYIVTTDKDGYNVIFTKNLDKMFYLNGFIPSTEYITVTDEYVYIVVDNDSSKLIKLSLDLELIDEVEFSEYIYNLSFINEALVYSTQENKTNFLLLNNFEIVSSKSNVYFVTSTNLNTILIEEKESVLNLILLDERNEEVLEYTINKKDYKNYVFVNSINDENGNVIVILRSLVEHNKAVSVLFEIEKNSIKEVEYFDLTISDDLYDNFNLTNSELVLYSNNDVKIIDLKNRTVEKVDFDNI